MTRQREVGSETDFSAWLREDPDLDSCVHRLTVTDNDYIFHRYMTDVDNVGTRQVQQIMCLETKTRSGTLTPSQHETLFFWNQLTDTTKSNGDRVTMTLQRPGRPEVDVWSWGVRILSMSGTRPDNSTTLSWGSFTDTGDITWQSIALRRLKQVLRFEYRPDNVYRQLELRRHHLTRELVKRERTPLGIMVDTIVKRRS